MAMKPTEVDNYLTTLTNRINDDRVVVSTNISVPNDDIFRRQAYFVAGVPMEVINVSETHDTALSDNENSITLNIFKATGTEAPTDELPALLTNLRAEDLNPTTGFNLKAAANTVQDGTNTTVVTSLRLAIGDRLVYGFNGTLSTTYIGITTTLDRVEI